MKKYIIVPILLLVCFLQFQPLFSQQRSESDDFSYALKLYNEKFFSLAAQQFSRFTNNYPGSNKVAEAGYYSGMSYYFLREYENARIEFQRVAVDFPKQDRSADSWYMIGECYTVLKNDEEAAKSFEMVKLLHPNHERAAESILRAGQIYYKLKRFEVAEQLYNLIQTRYLESQYYFPSVLAHGILLLEKEQISRAKEKFEKVIASKDNISIKAEAWYYLGETYRLQGNYQQAIPPYQNVVKTYKNTPIYPKTVLSLTQIYLYQQNYSRAQQLIDSALKNNPPGMYLSELEEKLGDAYYLGEKFALAGKHYQSSINVADSLKLVKINLKLAFTWYKQNNLTKASEIVREIVMNEIYQEHVNYQEIKNLYFKWLIENADTEKGLSDIYSIRRGGGSSRTDLSWLIQFLKIQKDWQGIVREVQPAIYSDQRFEEKDDFIMEIASAYMNLLNFPESAKFYRMLIDDFPASEFINDANDKLSFLRNHHLVDESFGIGQMALLIGDVIDREDESKLQFNLGKIYYTNLKDFNSALTQFQTALNGSQNPELTVHIYHYIGLTYQRMAEANFEDPVKRGEYLNLAKENLSKAMENLSVVSDQDLIAWNFVSLGIVADNSPIQKQIGYYEMLVQKYPNSHLREHWYEELGMMYKTYKNNSEKAFKYYDSLVKEFRNSKKFPIYLYERAVLSLLLKNNLPVIEDFKLIAGSYPYSPPAAKALYNLGVAWEAEGSYKQANRVYSRFLSEYYYSDKVEKVRLKIGDTYLYAGESKQAIKIYKDILIPLEMDDVILGREFTSENQSDLSFKLAKAYYDHKDLLNARKYFITYLSVNPSGYYSGDANYFMGNIYLNINDPQSAIASFSNIPSSNKTYYASALEKIADIRFDLKEYKQSAESYKKLAEITSDAKKKSAIQARQIISLIRSGKKSSADKLIGVYRKTYKSALNHLASFQFEYGNYYRKTKNFNQAVNFFNKVKKSYSKSTYVDDADYYLALTYIALNRHEDALEILTRFAQKYPGSENLGAVLNTLGSIYFRSEKYESAIISFKSAIDKPLKPEVKQQVMSNLIKAYTFVNFWDAVLALSREYIETYPDADDVIDKKILMGRAFVSLNQVDRAVELLKETRLIADSEREPEIQFYIGDAYFQTGQYENAIAEYVKIPLLSRKTKLQWEASALYYSGQAYEKLGRISDAKRMYSEIVKRPGIDLVLKKEAQKRIKEIDL